MSKKIRHILFADEADEVAVISTDVKPVVNSIYDMLHNGENFKSVSASWAALHSDDELDQMVKDGRQADVIESLQPWVRKVTTRSYWLIQTKLQRPIYHDFAEVIESIILEKICTAFVRFDSTKGHFRQLLNTGLSDLFPLYCREIGLPRDHYKQLSYVRIDHVADSDSSLSYQPVDSTVTDWVESLPSAQRELFDRLLSIGVEDKQLAVNSLWNIYFHDIPQKKFRSTLAALRRNYLEIAV